MSKFNYCESLKEKNYISNYITNILITLFRWPIVGYISTNIKIIK